MGQVKPNPPSKLIVGLIYRDETIKTKCLSLLQRHFGPRDYSSPILNFNYTNYYYPEFGRPLKRMFISFKKLACEENLANLKIYSNKIEGQFSHKGKRQINLDPGLLTLGKLVLATTKDYNHRIYLGKGIFAEVTLFYQKDTFWPWPWSYPDYQSREYLDIFNTIRKIYQEQISHAA